MEANLIKTINCKGKKVLIISDTHFPHHHPDTIPFLKAIKKKFKPDIVIHIGDEIDNHYISFHKVIAECRGGSDELTEAIKGLSELESLFRKIYLLDSNHGSLIFRRAKDMGIPLTYIRPLKDIYGTPDWEWHHDIILKTNHQYDTYLCHGKSSGYNKLATAMKMNAVQGHFHSKFEITYSKTVTGEVYNMFVGAFADDTEIAMEYGKNNLPKTITGCGGIREDGTPILFKMNLNKRGRWDKKLVIL